MNYISELSNRILKKFTVKNTSFKHAITTVKYQNHFVKFYNNSLNIIDSNLDTNELRLLNFSIITDIEKNGFTQNMLKKHNECKVLLNYCMNENKLKDKFYLSEKPDFYFKNIGIEITEAITPNQAIIRDILTRNVDSGKAKADLLDHFDDLVRVNHILANPTISKAKHSKLDLSFITSVIIDKLTKFNTFYTKYDKNIILVDVYDTLSFTNKDDLKFIKDDISKKYKSNKVVDEIHLYNDVFNIVGKIYLKTNIIKVEAIK